MFQDEGFDFGIGAFETMAVIRNGVILLDSHLERLSKALQYFGIDHRVTRQEVMQYLEHNPMENGVLKILVSEKNKIFQTRQNIYKEEDYHRGFQVKLSTIMRNETSPLTYMKSLNYGDNIIEKRRFLLEGYDEPIFMNGKGQITEGATSNIFMVRDKKIITPAVSCGLLEGTVRKLLMENFEVQEGIIYEDEVARFDEIFVTNALMGIMPVRRFAKVCYDKREMFRQCSNFYHGFISSSST